MTDYFCHVILLLLPFCFPVFLWVSQLKIFSSSFLGSLSIPLLVIKWVTLKFLICALTFKSIFNKYLFLLNIGEALREKPEWTFWPMPVIQYFIRIILTIPSVSFDQYSRYLVADFFRFHHVHPFLCLLFLIASQTSLWR